MAEIVVVANQKGGVGKTTTSINLSYALACLGQEVLLVDFDPQGNAGSGLGVTVEEGGKSVYHLITKTASFEQVIRQSSNELLDVLPSCKDLAAAEVELVNVRGRENMLKDALAPYRGMYDYIIIDCSPSLNILTLMALTAATDIIIPVAAQYMPLDGIAQLMNTVGLVKKRLNKGLQIGGVIITMYDSRRSLDKGIIEAVRATFPKETFNTIIKYNSKVAEAPTDGKDIFEYAPKGSGAAEYSALAKEIIEREG